MKIDYASDLHFNHWMRFTYNQEKWEKRTRALTNRLIENGSGEVLVLAGDFSEFNCQTLWILDEASKQYERVYFTYGNHDLYLLSKSQKKKYGDSIGRINELEERTKDMDNVVFLNKKVDTYKGKVFAGDVMWYLPKTQEDWSLFNDVSNDSEYIHMGGYNGCTKSRMCKTLHRQSMDWYNTIEDIDVDLFVSHVPPLHNPYSPFKPNGCYMVDVPFINTDHWICGHDHMQRDFNRFGVNFHMNAIGYADHYNKYHRPNSIPNQDVDTYKSFGIKSFEI